MVVNPKEEIHIPRLAKLNKNIYIYEISGKLGQREGERKISILFIGLSFPVQEANLDITN